MFNCKSARRSLRGDSAINPRISCSRCRANPSGSSCANRAMVSKSKSNSFSSADAMEVYSRLDPEHPDRRLEGTGQTFQALRSLRDFFYGHVVFLGHEGYSFHVLGDQVTGGILFT